MFTAKNLLLSLTVAVTATTFACQKKNASSDATDLTDAGPPLVVSGNQPVIGGEGGGSTVVVTTDADGTTKTTLSGKGDTTAPVVSDNVLMINSVGINNISLSWAEATDDSGTVFYDVYVSTTAGAIDSVASIVNGGVTPANKGLQSASVNLTSLTQDTTYYVNVMARDLIGNKTIYQSKAQKTTGDVIPPTPGAAVTPTNANLTATPGSQQMTITWYKATDNSYASTTLEYLLYYSTNGNLTDVAEIEANGTAVGSYQADIATGQVTGLSAATNYYFNVLVKDPEGNKAAYSRVAATTSGDLTLPTPGANGAITQSNVGAGSMDLTWTAGTDNFTVGSSLQYRVFYSTSGALSNVSDMIDAAGTPAAGVTEVVPWTTDVQTVHVAGLTPATTYYFNILLRDLGQNVTLYAGKTQATTADTTAPTAGASGTITTTGLTNQAVTLNWTKATDNASAPAALQYEVRQSASNNISTVANAEANGLVAAAYANDIATFNATGLSPSSTYYFNVIVKDAAGNKSTYTTKSVTTPADSIAPTVGNSGTVTTTSVGTSTLTLNWTKATDDVTLQGGLQYQIKYSTSNNMTTVATFNANGTLGKAYASNINTANLTGLTAGTAYFFNVMVKDNAGNESVYTSVSQTMVVDNPSTPGNSGTITSASITGTTLTLNWTKATDDVTAVAGLQYKVKYSTSNNLSTVANFNANGTVALVYTTDVNTANLSGLTVGTTYYFNVMVKDGFGNEQIYSTLTQATNAAPVPGSSGTVTAASVTTSTLTLNWTVATDDATAANALQYKVKYSTSNNLNTVANFNANGTLIQAYATDINTVNVTGLTVNTPYFFNVMVKDGFGNESVYTTLSQASAPDVAAVPGNSGTITTASVAGTTLTLNWTKATDDVTVQGSLQYKVKYSTTNNLATVANFNANGTLAQAYTTDINTANVTGLTAGTTYYFNVMVKDGVGNEQIYSTLTQATNAAPVPGNSGTVTAASVTTSALTLNWAVATDDTTAGASLQYKVKYSTANDLNTVANFNANGTLIQAYTSNINTVNVSGLTVNTAYFFNVMVKDGSGNETVYTTLSQSTAADVAAVPGNGGTITAASVAGTTLALNWTKATDDVTAQGSLQYKVKYSTTNNLATVANFNANGTLAQAYTNDINTANVSGLTAGTTYYFNVMVKDGVGNEQIYSTLAQATNAAPVPGNSGTVTAASVTTSALTLNWTVATDDATAGASLQYKVKYSTSNNLNSVANFNANGTLVQAYTANINTVNISGLTVNTPYFFNVMVKDGNGNEAVYTTLSQSTAADVAAIPGNSGTITIASVTASTLTLNWTKATDDVTAQASLQYKIKYSTSSNLNSVANFNANGTLVQAYTADINTVNVTGLTPGTTYYFNVMVADGVSNEQIYTTKTFTDTTAPTPGNSGTVTTASVTTTGLTLNWTKATDDLLAQSGLQYKIKYSSSNNMATVANFNANGTLVQDFTADINTVNVTGMAPEATYYFNVLVKDAFGNQAVYTSVSQVINTDTTAPTAGNSGTISAVSSSIATDLNWTAATDDSYAPGSLQYRVFQSSSNNMGTVANTEARTAVSSFTTNINSLHVTGLSPSVTYYFNVVVEDGASTPNKAIYTTVSTTTSNDSVAPTVGGSGTITTASITTTGMTLNWTKGTDNIDTQANLSYLVCASTSTISTVVGCEANAVNSYTADINTYNVTALTEGTTYYFNVVIRDQGNNAALYTAKQQATTADTTVPSPGNFGVITTASITLNSLTLNWTAGTDDTFASNTLQYRVFQSASNNMGTVVNTEARTALNAYTTNINTLNVTGLAPSTTYYFNVVLKDGASTPNKQIYATVQVTTAADTAPTAGNSGTITTASVLTSSLTLNWTKATDAEDAQASLVYLVCKSASTISTAANCESNALNSYTADINTYNVSSLTQNTPYHFNVVVKDTYGNKTLFADKSQTTAPDTAPTAGNSGTITTASVGTTALTLNWTKATDGQDAQASLVYQVCQSSSTITTVAGCESNSLNAYTADINTYNVTGLAQATTYYFNSVVKDTFGNKTLYVAKQQATAGDVTAPIAGGGSGATLAPSNVSCTSVDIGWNKATDDTSAQSALSYQLCKNTTNNLTTAANCEANPVGSYTTDVATGSVTGLSPNTTYYFNVAVKDPIPNKSVYTQLTQATSADSTAPVAGGSGTLTYVDNSAGNINLTWTKAGDNCYAQSVVQYQVKYSTSNNINTVGGFNANGTLLQAYTTDIAALNSIALSEGATYYFNVMAKDPAGNESVYTSTSHVMPADVTAPTAGSSGTITTANVDVTTMDLNWTKATDNYYSQASLQYLVCQATASATINSIANCEANAIGGAGTYAIDIATISPTGLVASTTYYFNVVVKDGHSSPNKTFYTVKSQATAADTAPTAGNSGTITTASVTLTTLTLNWTKATDAQDAQASLVYVVCKSASTISTAANCESNALNTYTADINTYNVTSLTQNTTYHFNVVAKDSYGNKTLYTDMSQTTAADTAPTAGNSGTITTASVGTTSLTLNWTKATDGQDAQASLVYQACQSSSTISTVAGCEGNSLNAYTANINTLNVTGLAQATTYYFNVVVKDTFGNKTLYVAVQQASAADVTAPIAGGGSGATLAPSNISCTSMDIGWNKATDDTSAQSALAYQLCKNSTNNLTSVPNCEANPVGSYTTDVATSSLSGLSPNTTYYFNVAVKDAIPNKSLYTQLTQATAADTTAPIAGGSGTLGYADNGVGSINLTWTKAGDDCYIQSLMQYKVKYSTTNNINTVVNFNANGTLLQGYTSDIAALNTIISLTEGSTYYFNVMVKDPAGNESAYTSTSHLIPADTTAPTAGASGTITTANVSATSLDVNWTKATDNYYSQASLQYLVCQATAAATINSIANCETNAIGGAGLYQTDINTITPTGLTAATTYYFNVVVKDGHSSPNKTFYTVKSQATAADGTPPVAGTGVTVGMVTTTTVPLTWTKGTDNSTAQNSLQYQVYYDDVDDLDTVTNTETNGMLVGSYTTNIISTTVTGLLPNTAYYFQVIVRDAAFNKTIYTSSTGTTAIDVTAPTVGGSGTITTANIVSTSMDINWTKAVDDSYPQAMLTYAVCQATAAATINSIANCEANAVGGAGTYVTNIATKTVTGLTPNTTYYFNVVAQDPAGNKSLYTVKSQASALDVTPPTPGNSGTLGLTLGTTTAILTWTKGTDDSWAASMLQYEVCFHAVTDTLTSPTNCEAANFGSYVTDNATATVTGLSASTLYYFNVVMKDPSANKAIYTSISGTTGNDVTAPTVGGGGTITSSGILADSVTLSWSKGTDNASAMANLQYALYRSATNNLTTDAATVQANGTLVQAFTSDIATANSSGLQPSTVYYYNVVIRDEALNQSIYTQMSATTAADTVAPTVGTPTISLSARTYNSINLSWTVATDDFTPGASLQYEVRQSASNNISTVANAEANGTIVRAYTANSTTASITGLLPTTDYYFNVIVKDNGGNKSSYTTKLQRTVSAVHMAYADTTSTELDLMYGTNKSGAFAFEDVDTAGGTYNQLVLDSNLKPHIVYCNGTTASGTIVKYTNRISGAWATPKTIFTGTCSYVSAALDPVTNKVYASMYAASTSYRDLYYAYQSAASTSGNTGTWVIANTTGTVGLIEATNRAGQYNAIVYGSDGKVHIAHNESTNGDLRYAEGNPTDATPSTSWSFARIDGDGTTSTTPANIVGTYASMAQDSAGKMHVAYYDTTNTNLKYATNASGSWVTSTIDSTSAASTGNYTAIVVDASDTIHIIYKNNSLADLYYIKKPSGGSWSAPEGVDVSATISYGTYLSIASGSDGLIHMVGYDSTSNAGDIRYIYGSSGAWTKATLTGGVQANTTGKWLTIKAE